jgi:Tol biopolymer transport system component
VARGGATLALTFAAACAALTSCGQTGSDTGAIVFNGLIAAQRGNGGYFAERPDGTHLRKLAFAVTDYDLSFSADGRFAAMWNTRPLKVEPIVVSRADGSGRHVVPLPANSSAVSPSLSPDGKRVAIVYTPNAYRGPGNVWTVAIDGHGLKRLTSTGNAISAAWSPDGKRIVFVDQASVAERTHGFGRMYVVNPDGTGLRRIARGLDPSWSPDARRIAFSDRKGRIAVVDAEGGQRRVVARNGSGPAWSPDGKRLAFTRTIPCGSEDGCDQAVFVVDAQGGRARRVGPEFGGPGELLWTTAVTGRSTG